MAKKNLLLVDADSKSLRMLEVSLRKSGFSVTTAISASDARDKVKLAQPDLIITDTKLPGDENGFELVANLKSAPETQGVPIIFLSSENKLEQKVTGLELGVEDYLTKPIYIREVLTRVRVLLEKREKEKLERRERSATFAGSLGEMGLVDLIQTVEIGRKTGRLYIEARGQQGVIAFREGKVCDARCARLSGERAFYRMLVWNEGAFSMEFGAHDEADVIELSTQGLLMEGMRRVDEWGRLLEQLPPLERVFEIDYTELVDRLAEIPDEINGILRLFDGRRTLLEVVDESDFGDLEALEIASKLFFEGLIYDVTDRPADESEPAPQQVARIEAWLEGGEGGEADVDGDVDDGAVLENARLEPTLPPTMLDDVAISAPPAELSTLPQPANPSTLPRLAELTPSGDIVAPAPAPAPPPQAAPLVAALPSVPPVDASRVPGFVVSQKPTGKAEPAQPAPAPRPLPALEPEERQARSVAPRAAVNATAWSSLPKGSPEDGWEDVVAPEDDLGLSEAQGKRPPPAPELDVPNELSSVEHPAREEPTAETAAPTIVDPARAGRPGAEDLAAQISAALPPELSSEATSGFDDEPLSADRLARAKGTFTPTPTLSTAPNTIPEAPASSAAAPTVINPVQAAQQAKTEPPPSRPPAPPREADAPEVTPVERRPPRPPPSTDLGSLVDAAAAETARPGRGSDRATRDDDDDEPRRDVGERIHTVRTAIDIEPPPSRLSPAVIGAAAGIVALGLFLGVFLAGQGDAEPQPATDAGAVARVDVSQDAGPVDAVDAIDAGAQVALTPAVVDAGPPPVAVVVDAGTTPAPTPPPAIVDAGPPPRVALADAGPKAPPVGSPDEDPTPAPGPDAEYAAHLKTADVASKRGDFNKSVKAYKAALALKPSSVPAHLGLGNAYYELDENDSALVHLEKARALAPRDAQLYVLLGAVYQSAGRKSDAVTAYQRYLELAPNGKFARDVKGILRGLGVP